MSEKNISLPSLRNENWKTVKEETEKNELSTNISTNIKRTNLCRSEISL